MYKSIITSKYNHDLIFRSFDDLDPYYLTVTFGIGDYSIRFDSIMTTYSSEACFKEDVIIATEIIL